MAEPVRCVEMQLREPAAQCFGCGAVYSESYEFVEVAAIAPRD